MVQKIKPKKFRLGIVGGGPESWMVMFIEFHLALMIDMKLLQEYFLEVLINLDDLDKV